MHSNGRGCSSRSDLGFEVGNMFAYHMVNLGSSPRVREIYGDSDNHYDGGPVTLGSISSGE